MTLRVFNFDTTEIWKMPGFLLFRHVVANEKLARMMNDTPAAHESYLLSKNSLVTIGKFLFTRKNAQVVTNLQQTCSIAVPTTCYRSANQHVVTSFMMTSKLDDDKLHDDKLHDDKLHDDKLHDDKLDDDKLDDDKLHDDKLHDDKLHDDKLDGDKLDDHKLATT